MQVVLSTLSKADCFRCSGLGNPKHPSLVEIDIDAWAAGYANMHIAANLGRHFPAALRRLFSYFRKFSRSLCLNLCSARNNCWNSTSLLPAGNQILCNKRQFIWRWGNTLGYISRSLQNDSQHCTYFSHLLFLRDPFLQYPHFSPV